MKSSMKRQGKVTSWADLTVYPIFIPWGSHWESHIYHISACINRAFTIKYLDRSMKMHKKGTSAIRHLSFLTSCHIRQKLMVQKYFC